KGCLLAVLTAVICLQLCHRPICRRRPATTTRACPTMAILQIVNPAGGSEQVELPSDRNVMGRHPECEVVLESASVSRQHAMIIKQDGQFFIEDLHSRNGTFVNGQLIAGRKLLQDGDRLKICDLTFTFYSNQPSDRMPLTETS